jgi:hypothetical protein
MVEVGDMPAAADAPVDRGTATRSETVDRLLRDLGWQVRPSNPARHALAR